MITVSTVSLKDFSCLEVNKREVMRYLGVKDADEITLELYAKCVKEIYSVINPRAVYIKTDISVKEDFVDFGFMKANSKNLSKNLNDCGEAYVFCATLGIGADRHFEKLFKVSKAKATVFSAVASSLIESFCDYINNMLSCSKSTSPRFSCGYGDFSLEHQKDILNVLGADKRLGICLTDSYMMIPVKTVTAIVGIRR